MDKLFFKVWKNVYLNRIINDHLKLYNENKEKTFEHVQDIKDYGYREYIEKINYTGRNEKLTNDLFPKYGVLKYIKIKNEEFDTMVHDEAYIPEGVEKLEFWSVSYERCPIELTNLPSSITSLIGYTYNDISKTIPSNITTFSISDSSRFDQRITSNSFESVTNLELGFWFNNGGTALQNGCLSSTLKVLDILGFRNSIDIGVLPDSITNLSLSISNNKSLEQNIYPKYLETLSILLYSEYNFQPKIECGILPNSLTNLKIDSNELEIEISPKSLPNSLKVLEFSNNLKNSIVSYEMIGHLENLESFKLISNKTVIGHGALPKFGKLLKLVYGFFKKTSIDLEIGFFPESITNLTLYLHFVNPLPIGYFPNNLKSLTLGRYYNHPFEIGLLPSTLVQLAIGDGFSQPVEEYQLPCSLLKLTLGLGWDQPWNYQSFPLSLQYLEISFEYPFKNDITTSCPSFKTKYITYNEKANYEMVN